MADVEGTIFTTQNCYDVLGTNKPQHIIKWYMEDSLEHNDLTHDISISYDYFSIHDHCAHDNYETEDHHHSVMNDSGTKCALHHFGEHWVEGHPDQSRDFNHLLVLASDYDGSNWGAEESISKGAEYINKVDTSCPRYAEGYKHAWVNVALHEIGHSLTLDHGDGLVWERWWESDNKCYVTPLAPKYENKKTNNCDEDTLDRDYCNDYKDHYHWYPCSGDKMRSNYA